MPGPQMYIASDVILLSVFANSLQVLLVRRDEPPFQGSWCLPGGIVGLEESLEEAAERILFKHSHVREVYLEQLYTFGDPHRDPRQRSISVSYFALVSERSIKSVAADGAGQMAQWFPIDSVPQLGFDHGDILAYALTRVRWKVEYTTVAFSLLDKEFTLGDLQGVYEAILGRPLDSRNFRKKIIAQNILEKTGKQVVRGAYRPANTYRFVRRNEFFLDML